MSAVKHFLMADMVLKVYKQQQFRVFPCDFHPLLICGLGAI